MKDLFFVLGASDPEMCRIAKLLHTYQVRFAYAKFDGKYVNTKNASTAEPAKCMSLAWRRIVFVECRVVGIEPYKILDHHAPGDAGYSVEPGEFPKGSTLGQVWRFLVIEGVISGAGAPVNTEFSGKVEWEFVDECWQLLDLCGCRVQVPQDHLLAMAADHCLLHAYSGLCPGIDACTLLDWRIETRADFQKRLGDELRQDVLDGLELLKHLDFEYIAGEKIVHAISIPELTEAAAISRTGFLLETFNVETGRVSLRLRAFRVSTIEHWMSRMKAMPSFEVYGNPYRGYAGASCRLVL